MGLLQNLVTIRQMSQEFFKNLPPEIITNILSRLPVQYIVRCKCVCKSWLDPLDTREFVKYHLSNSVPGLAVYQSHRSSKLYRIYEFEDALDLEHHELHYHQVTNFDLPYDGLIQGSANGLLFLRDLSIFPGHLFVCNPITREYVEIYCPQEFVYSTHTKQVTYTFGFGASKATGQHKVVKIFHDLTRDQESRKWRIITKSESLVYTLGTGSWRSIAPSAPFVYNCRSIGAFLNGNLHSLVTDLNGCPWISCFDLETELFSTFATPLRSDERLLAGVFALGDCRLLMGKKSIAPTTINCQFEF